jgi:hypothetical protein
MKGLNFILSIYTGLSFCEVAKGWANIVGGKFFYVVDVQNSFVLLMLVHDTFFINVQRDYCHTKQLVQWFDLMLKGLAW